MFVLHASEVVDLEAIPNPLLHALHSAWKRWRGWRALPSLGRFNPAEVAENVGRMHLVEPEGDGSFRFLHYGTLVTNPDALDMTGRSTRDYHDVAFRALVEAHYGEAVEAGTAVCRSVIASSDNGPYEYIRMVLPFGERGVEFLVIGTQRINVPPAYDRAVVLQEQARALRAQADRSRRLAREIDDPVTLHALHAMSSACDLRAAEIERMGG